MHYFLPNKDQTTAFDNNINHGRTLLRIQNKENLSQCLRIIRAFVQDERQTIIMKDP